VTPGDGAAEPPARNYADGKPTWPKVAVVVAVLALAFVAARACQQDQVRIAKDEAIAIAEERVDFEPVNRQVRFLRQGLDRRPFWFVSLSIPAEPGSEQEFSRLVVVRVDATNGEVEDLSERTPQGGGGKNGAGKQGGGS